MREEAVWAENLTWTLISAPTHEELMKKLFAWRDDNPKAAVLGIDFASEYSYVPYGDADRGDPVAWGLKTVLITLQKV